MSDKTTQSIDTGTEPVNEQAQPPAGDPTPASGYSPATGTMGTTAPKEGLVPDTSAVRTWTFMGKAPLLSLEDFEEVLKANSEKLYALLERDGLTLISKDAAAGGGAQRILSPNEQLAQHMATYNPGVTHEMKGTPPAVATDEEEEEPQGTGGLEDTTSGV